MHGGWHGHQSIVQGAGGGEAAQDTDAHMGVAKLEQYGGQEINRDRAERKFCNFTPVGNTGSEQENPVA